MTGDLRATGTPIRLEKTDHHPLDISLGGAHAAWRARECGIAPGVNGGGRIGTAASSRGKLASGDGDRPLGKVERGSGGLGTGREGVGRWGGVVGCELESWRSKVLTSVSEHLGLTQATLLTALIVALRDLGDKLSDLLRGRIEDLRMNIRVSPEARLE